MYLVFISLFKLSFSIENFESGACDHAMSTFTIRYILDTYIPTLRYLVCNSVPARAIKLADHKALPMIPYLNKLF